MPKRAVPPDSSAAASSHDARHNHGLPVPQDAEASRRDGKSQSWRETGERSGVGATFLHLHLRQHTKQNISLKTLHYKNKCGWSCSVPETRLSPASVYAAGGFRSKHCRNTESISDYDLKIEHLYDNWIQIYFLVMNLLIIQALTKGLVRSCVGPYQLDKGHTASWTRDQGITDFITYGTCPWLCTQEGRTPWSLEERDFISYASLHYQSTFSVRFEE